MQNILYTQLQDYRSKQSGTLSDAVSSSSGLIIDGTFDSFEIQLAEYKKKHTNYHTTLSQSPRKLSTKTSIQGMNLSTNC